jgi:hypothetical protein
MKSRTTKQFWELYSALPKEIQELADKAYELWQNNPHHPGLQFKQVDPEKAIYSARVGRNYRALGILRDGTITWFWIGKHEVYDRILR